MFSTGSYKPSSNVLVCLGPDLWFVAFSVESTTSTALSFVCKHFHLLPDALMARPSVFTSSLEAAMHDSCVCMLFIVGYT